jgi:hypothetical protein
MLHINTASFEIALNPQTYDNSLIMLKALAASFHLSLYRQTPRL